MDAISQITVEELALRLAEKDHQVQLIDVRESEEVALAAIEGFQLLPLSEFAQWSGEIKTRFNPNEETLVMCHHGIRSAQMCQWLLNNGFTNVKNISGGIDAYSLKVDRTVPRY
ncbi:MAG: rhodanese-related sulfurtransferase [Gomphosphaeria aponina SAG 52.96 = DSM 107014]|uniref:Rhodanese-related sulfurtransferase n=1 Tax=Gomphosphaeria aponina SAG 52.96 = DSM 107014 TaxID=1521640 RepID=A0A941GT68_9CHRO|nr:rhodanese-related sulfurtransferase [Gomphosphaeria aponina SAG 52.96 = DSM 107014]